MNSFVLYSIHDFPKMNSWNLNLINSRRNVVACHCLKLADRFDILLADPETHKAIINQTAVKLRPELSLQINDTLHLLPLNKCVCGVQ